MKRDRIPEFLDALVIDPHITPAARKIGINAATVFRWLERIKNDDPDFVVEWCGISDQFWRHARSAAKMSISLIESQARSFALAGWQEPVIFQGRQCFVEDERCAGIDPDSYGLLGLPLDGMKRDENGNRIPLTVTRKPSDALITLMLRSHMPRVYGEKSSVDVNVGGVLRLERPDERSAPKTIEHQVTDSFMIEDDGDAKAPRGQLALGRPAKDSAEMDKWNAAGEFLSTPVTFVDAEGNRTEHIAAPDPLLPQPRDSDLVKDLKANAAAPPAHPRPTAVVQVGKPSDKPPAPKQPAPAKPYVRPDDRAEGIGRGTVRPGGFKMA